MYTSNQEVICVNTQKQTTAPYEVPNQSIKSSIKIELSPMYNLTQSQNRYKKEFLIV